MLTGKIILKSATKLTLDKRFSEIAKQTPPQVTPRIQRANVIIPQSRQELFGNRPSAAMGAAARLKKRSINNRLGLGPRGTPMRPYTPPVKRNVFQRITSGNRRRGGGFGANAYLYGGQSGMGVRLRGEGRINTTRTFRSRTRGFLNNEFIGRVTGNQQRGNRFRPNRGRVSFSRNKNFNRPNRARGGRINNRGGRGFNRNRNNNNQNNNNSSNNPKQNVTREKLDDDLDQYMSKTKLDEESGAMDAV